MKTLTATLATSDKPMPSGRTSPWAGFRVRIKNVATSAESTTPVQVEAVFVLGPFVEGSQYQMTFESVDAAGVLLQALATIDVPVPAAQTYRNIDTVSLAWS